jgi:hypothetical protein
MPHQIERKLAFQPHALNDLTRAFDTAWQELRAQGVESNTEEHIQLAARPFTGAMLENCYSLPIAFRKRIGPTALSRAYTLGP